MQISDLDTPAVLIDLEVMERNLDRVAAYCRENGLRLRPHTKTHKIPAIGALQLARGAAGLTVAKVGEAEVMLASGTQDLLVAYPVIGQRKLERLVEVAKKVQVTVALDSLFAARQLSDAARAAGVTFGVLAEVDVGLRRVGVAPGELLGLAQGIVRLPRLKFEGIAFYPGHLKMMDEQALEELRELDRTLKEVLRKLRAAGLECRVVSGGSTPSLFQSHLVSAMNEIRPGTYVFNDRNTVMCGACGWEDCAACVLVTVVSTAVPGQMIVDGGSKTFSSDRLVTGEAGFGRVIEAPEAVFTKMNEEHGFLDIRRAGVEFEVGDRVRIIPNHICAVMNLHERVYGIRGGEVEQVWTVEGRGKLQ
jgi:D-serine deaminase-like pyridoxal phosphate-dependent protein